MRRVPRFYQRLTKVEALCNSESLPYIMPSIALSAPAVIQHAHISLVQRHLTIRTFGGAIQVQDAPVAIETNKIRALGLHQDPVYLLVRGTSSTLTNRRRSIRRRHRLMNCGRCGRVHGLTEMRLCSGILVRGALDNAVVLPALDASPSLLTSFSVFQIGNCCNL